MIICCIYSYNGTQVVFIYCFEYLQLVILKIFVGLLFFIFQWLEIYLTILNLSTLIRNVVYLPSGQQTLLSLPQQDGNLYRQLTTTLPHETRGVPTHPRTNNITRTVNVMLYNVHAGHLAICFWLAQSRAFCDSFRFSCFGRINFNTKEALLLDVQYILSKRMMIRDCVHSPHCCKIGKASIG